MVINSCPSRSTRALFPPPSGPHSTRHLYRRLDSQAEKFEPSSCCSPSEIQRTRRYGWLWGGWSFWRFTRKGFSRNGPAEGSHIPQNMKWSGEALLSLSPLVLTSPHPLESGGTS